MSIDIHGEKLLTLSQAARSLPKCVAPSTLWRWHRRGLRGIRLDTVLIGGTRFTSSEAVMRFATALTGLDYVLDPEATTGLASIVRTESHEARLRAAGLL